MSEASGTFGESGSRLVRLRRSALAHAAAASQALSAACDRLARPAGLRLIARISAVTALVIVLAPIMLAALYAAVPPVSALMLTSWMRGEAVDRRWLGLEDISPNLPLAVLASEDQRFCRHDGVDWRALWRVLDRSTDGRPDRGASTLPMQTARNLFLWPEKSWFRKAVEIVLALYIDALWSKERMMEVYLNIAEWGPGVYGAEAAARHYFEKSAATLDRREAALLAAALPNPFLRNAERPGPHMRRMASLIEARAAAAAALAECLDLAKPGR